MAGTKLEPFFLKPNESFKLIQFAIGMTYLTGEGGFDWDFQKGCAWLKASAASVSNVQMNG